jgi:hypothetical protein
MLDPRQSPNTELRAEARFNRLVLGGWWLAVAVIGGLRLWRGDIYEAIILLSSASLTALLGVALSIDRERGAEIDAPGAEALRLHKATMLFSVIAISTVIGCAMLNGAIWWAAFECAAVVWILPAVIMPLIQAYVRKRSERVMACDEPLADAGAPGFSL